MLSIIIWYFLFITLFFGIGLASTSKNWPRPWPWLQSPGLGLGLRALASVSASLFWPCLTSLSYSDELIVLEVSSLCRTWIIIVENIFEQIVIIFVLLCSAVDALDGEEDFYYTEVEESLSTSSSSLSSSSSPIHNVTCTTDIARPDATAMDHDYQRKVCPMIFFCCCLNSLGWRRSVVVCELTLINVVNQHWARLLLGWVTVCGQVNHLGM